MGNLQGYFLAFLALRERANLLVVLIGFCALMVPFCGQAGAFTEIGLSHREQLRDMLWWQPGYQNEMNLTSIYARVGKEWDVFGFSARAYSQFLGCYGTEALATPDEDDYIKGSGGACKFGPCKPPDKYKTNGCVGGVGLSGVFRIGNVSFEAGPTFNVQSFHLRASAIHDDSQYWSFRNGKRRFSDIEAGFGHMAGIGYDAGKLSARAMVYVHERSSKFQDGKEYLPSGVEMTYSATIGYSF